MHEPPFAPSHSKYAQVAAAALDCVWLHLSLAVAAVLSGDVQVSGTARNGLSKRVPTSLAWLLSHAVPCVP